jgi:hypothetical protein
MNIPFPFLNLEFLYYQIYRLFAGQLSVSAFYDHLVDFSASFMPYSTIISLILVSGIIYCYIRYGKIEHDMEHSHESVMTHSAHSSEKIIDKRWYKVVEHLDSDNESDWRLAILEADLILEEMLNKMGYFGDSIGERLKSIEKSDFNSIDKAWEAHRIRNLIVHEGSNFKMSNREARRTVHLYEQVFKEFHLI